MKKALLFLAATLLLLPAFAQNYQPGNIKPGDYIIRSSKDKHKLVVIDGGLRDNGFVNKNMRAIKDRVVGIVAYVQEDGVPVAIDLMDHSEKLVLDKLNKATYLKPGPTWFVPKSSQITRMNYAAVQHSLQQLIDAGRSDVHLIHSDSDYWTCDDGYNYEGTHYKGTAWYHYKGRIKTRSRWDDAKLFVRTMFKERFNYNDEKKEWSCRI